MVCPPPLFHPPQSALSLLTRLSVNAWGLTAQVYSPVLYGSLIAAASSYSNVSSGYETWIEVLSLAETGIEVSTWSGAINDWLVQNANPPVMASNGKKFYGGITITALGKAFAVVTTRNGQQANDTIESWQVANDLVDWSFIGNVNVSNFGG